MLKVVLSVLLRVGKMLLDYKCYDEIVDEFQATIYWMIKEDDVVASFIKFNNDRYNLYDGDPTTQGRVGFPYVVVHTPTFTEKGLTVKKKEIVLTSKIEVVDKKEGNVRKLVGAIMNAFRKEQQRFSVKGFDKTKIDSSSLSQRFLPNETSKPVWIYTLNVSSRWFG